MKTIFLIKPRGFCAGVSRAIKTLELTQKLFKQPIYAFNEIVHNKHVVKNFKNKGILFIKKIDNIPNSSTIVFSAHGVSPKIKKIAREKKLNIIDATCPLVNKTHIEAKNFNKLGYKIILIGKKNHEEVEGIMGEAPINLIENLNEIKKLNFKTNKKIACLTQTTLSQDETIKIITALKQKFNNLTLPPKKNICYATQNRQNAVKKLAKLVDIVIVIGSKNSSNSNKLKEIAKKITTTILIDSEKEVSKTILTQYEKIGIASGASAPEYLVKELITKIKKAFPNTQINEIKKNKENITFPLPLEIKKAQSN